ncbi:MAG: conjugal transfer entry exclusion protein TraS [Aeromonas popoffii]|uniref:conjugal transfer entry exclusion protein TraS n=1 Tax=Aeromonas popoffii TaxID=70856 RepID=UPI003F3916AD
MKITNKVIRNDVSFIINELKKNELEIPSFLLCAAPGVVILAGMMIFQLLILSPFQGRLINNAFPISFSLLLGFITFCIVTQAQGKYLSLPKSVRKDSVLIKFVSRKIFLYGSLWIISNLIFGACTMTIGFDEALYNVFQLVSLVFLWFIAIVDLGRYDLALLSSAIKQWREGGDVDASLHKP